MSETKLGWHFLKADRKLGYGDNRLVVDGETLSHEGEVPPKCCEIGMHASEHVYQALRFAPGLVLCRVEVSGNLDSQYDKFVGRHRKVKWSTEIPLETVVAYARWCADRAKQHAADAASAAAAYAAYAANSASYAADYAAYAANAANAERLEQQKWWEERLAPIIAEKEANAAG